MQLRRATPVTADACSASTSRCASPQSRDSISRACTWSASDTAAVRCATQTANTNGRPVHSFHSLAQIVDEGIVGRAGVLARARARRLASRSAASPMTRRASCGSSSEARNVGELGVARSEHGPRVPDVLEQEPREGDARHRAAADSSTRRPGERLGGHPREEHHTAHGSVAGDREIGEQEVARRVARVLDRGDRRSRRADRSP